MTDIQKCITPVFQGGIGNNLYQIAVTISLSIDNKSKPVFLLPTNIEKKHIAIYGGHDIIAKDNLPKTLDEIFPNLFFIKNNEDIGNFIKNKDYHKEFDWRIYEEIKFNNNDLVIDGFFFAYKYFGHNIKSIVKYLEPSASVKKYINDKYSEILSRQAVGVHYRFGNKNDMNTVMPIPFSWYKRVFKKLSTKSTYVICSDNVSQAKIFFKPFENKYNMQFIDGEPMYIDLLLMSLCDHNITHCSTFSAWSAFLNKNPNKKVFVFNPNFIHIHGKESVPESWIDIDSSFRKFFMKYYFNKNYNLMITTIKKIQILNFLIPIKRFIVKLFFK